MTGSILDGEDIVQETYAKAYELLSSQQNISNLRGWLYRMAHNKAIDYLRASKIRQAEELDEDLLATEPEHPLEAKELALMTMSVFLRLAPMQRAAVILKDVLGYSLQEISDFLDIRVTSVKGALNRGRKNLRAFSSDLKEEPRALDKREIQLLEKYVERFNARDFDAVRQMLAHDVHMNLVGRQKLSGEKVKGYLGNYGRVSDWLLAVGVVDEQPAILVLDPEKPEAPPQYFMLISWNNVGEVARITDFRYARHIMLDAKISG
jgi:RNA polymerase sigma-70 factor (ECF subfamily)